MKDLTKYLKVEFVCGKWYIIHRINGALLEDFKTEEEANEHLKMHKAAHELLEASMIILEILQHPTKSVNIIEQLKLEKAIKKATD